MASHARTFAAALSDYGRALLDANFYPEPSVPMGFDAHVKAWRHHTGIKALVAYDRSPVFRAAVEERRAQLRSAA